MCDTQQRWKPWLMQARACVQDLVTELAVKWQIPLPALLIGGVLCGAVVMGVVMYVLASSLSRDDRARAHAHAD